MENEERPLSPAEALRAVEDTRASVADQGATPRWYYVAMSAVVASYSALQLLPETSRGLMTLVPTGALVTIVLVYSSRTPYRVNGWRAPGVRRAGVLLGGVAAALMILGTILERAADLPWAWAPIAVVVFCWSLFCCGLIERSWQTWMREDR